MLALGDNVSGDYRLAGRIGHATCYHSSFDQIERQILARAMYAGSKPIRADDVTRPMNLHRIKARRQPCCLEPSGVIRVDKLHQVSFVDSVHDDLRASDRLALIIEDQSGDRP